LADKAITGVEEPALQYGHASQVFHFLGFNQGDMADILEVDPSTLSRWKKRDMPVGKLRSRILIDMDHIIAKGVRIFGSEEAFQRWVQTPNYALGDQTPLEILKSTDGISLLENTLEALSWGNIS
jgi:putative toxin-antitoxin system antitoxin component (TIGR02293 family)